MGVAIKDILEYEEKDLRFFSNKTIAIDTFNMLYQFLAGIRQADGSQLTDSNGNITSHLKGLFNRCVYFKRNNIKAIFIFDGKSPKLKEKEQQMRRQKKEEANKKYLDAIERGNFEDARKFAQANNKLDTKMIEEAKTLISKFGFPVIDAPSEGEAQAAYMVEKNKIFASSSQDFDSLLFGAKFLIRNLSLSNKRKIPGTSSYKEVPIEFYDLDKNLEKLNLTIDQLIILAILCGTDFNPGGIKRIGPKKALKLVKEYNEKWDELFKEVKWDEFFEHKWEEVFDIFKNIPTIDVEYEFKTIDKKEIKLFLNKFDFADEMLDRSLNTIKNVKTLESFF